MTKRITLKLIAALFAVLLIITTALTISVSYAKWVAIDNTTVSGSAEIGEWGPQTIIPEFENEIYVNGNHEQVSWNDGYGNLYGKVSFTIEESGQKIIIAAFQNGEMVNLDEFTIIISGDIPKDGVTIVGNQFTFTYSAQYTVGFNLRSKELFIDKDVIK